MRACVHTHTLTFPVIRYRKTDEEASQEENSCHPPNPHTPPAAPPSEGTHCRAPALFHQHLFFPPCLLEPPFLRLLLSCLSSVLPLFGTNTTCYSGLNQSFPTATTSLLQRTADVQMIFAPDPTVLYKRGNIPADSYICL